MTEPTLASRLSGIQGLLLDIDDTILDTRWAMTTAGVPAVAALWPNHGHVHAEMSQRYYDDPGGWFRRYASGELTISAQRLARLEEVASHFGAVLPDAAEETYLAAYLPAFRTSQRLFEDVPELLSAADAAGLPVVLLTNSTDLDTGIKLEVLGIRDRFAGVVTTDTLGFGKPDARVYLEACRLIGAPAGAAVCIGDSLEWDVVGAERAGLRAVWLDRADSGQGGGAVTVRGLDEVAGALRAGHAADLGESTATGSIPSRFTS